MNQHCRVVPKLRNSRVVQIGHPACVSDAQNIQKWPKYAIKLGTSPHFPCVFPVFPTWLAAFLFQFGMFGVSHLQFWLAIIAHQPPNKFAFNFSLNFALNFTKKAPTFSPTYDAFGLTLLDQCCHTWTTTTTTTKAWISLAERWKGSGRKAKRRLLGRPQRQQQRGPQHR